MILGAAWVNAFELAKICVSGSFSSACYLQDPQDYSARAWISPIPPGINVKELIRFMKVQNIADLILPLLLSPPLAHILARGCLTFMKCTQKTNLEKPFPGCWKDVAWWLRLCFLAICCIVTQIHERYFKWYTQRLHFLTRESNILSSCHCSHCIWISLFWFQQGTSKLS